MGSASHARVCADALRVFGLGARDERSRRSWVRIFCITLPLMFLASLAYFKAPKQLVLAGGFIGALMLPLLGVADVGLHMVVICTMDRRLSIHPSLPDR